MEGTAKGLDLIAAREVRPLALSTVVSNLTLLADGAPPRAPLPEWKEVRHALSIGEPAFLYDVMSRPLLLGLAMRSSFDPDPLLTAATEDEAVQYILVDFYQHAIESGHAPYARHDADRWLGWVAWFLRYGSRTFDRTTFYLDDLTPDRGDVPAWAWVLINLLNITSDDDGALEISRRARFRALRREGVLPPHPAAFFDWAVDSGILRRMGRGYEFRHLELADAVATNFRRQTQGDARLQDQPQPAAYRR